jgi:hypothetical protein
MPSRMEQLHLYIAIAAAFVVTVICIVRNETLYTTSIWIPLTIIVFYLIGQFTRY